MFLGIKQFFLYLPQYMQHEDCIPLLNPMLLFAILLTVANVQCLIDINLYITAGKNLLRLDTFLRHP